MTLDVTTPEVYTSQGVPIIVDGVAQIKVRKDESSLHAAAERFLGKKPDEIARIALETVQGHLRAILGTLSVEDIYKNRDQFAQKVQEISAGDLANMGLGIDSFTIRDIRDKHGYLEALGKPRIAEVRRNAAIAEAQASRDSAIAQADAERETRERQAEAQRLAQEAEAKRDAAVAEANASRVRRQKEADAAAHRAAEVANFQADRRSPSSSGSRTSSGPRPRWPTRSRRRRWRSSCRSRRSAVARRSSDATIKRKADAERYEIETLAAAHRRQKETEAEGEKNRLTLIAEGEKMRGFAAADVAARQGQAEGEAQRARGLAEAAIRQAQGLAEAEARKAQGLADALGMEKKADAWRRYNEAAVIQIIAPLLPDIARAIAEPLARVDRITMVNTGGNGDIGVSRITGEVAKVVAQVPPVLESLTGLRLDDLLARLREKGEPASPATTPAADPPAQDRGDDSAQRAPSS